MKKLILLSALLIFACSYGQTYEDIISIDSKEQFIRIGIENDYEVITKNDNSIQLGLEPTKNKNGDILAKGFASYSINNSFISVGFQFFRNNTIQKSKYDKIFSFVKNNLEFIEVLADASWYTLDEKRRLGFTIDKDWCYVLLYLSYE